MATFNAADILVPQNVDFEKWAVIACDQFTSQPDYWERVEKTVGTAKSALRLVLPEVFLKGDYADQVAEINRTMGEYAAAGVFKEYPGVFVYVERTLQDGSIRHGVVGMVDLEQYDYSDDASSDIRATESTVVTRIPPRVEIRRNAPVELPHVLLLCDDEERIMIEPLEARKDAFPVLYDFDLMEDGGRIVGRLIAGEEAARLADAVARYEASAASRYGDLRGVPFNYASGDGNHSLATAKACYELLKASDPSADFSGHPARYALLELENIHDPALRFEPIHRFVFETDPEKLMAAMGAICSPDGVPVKWYSGEKSGEIRIAVSEGGLPVVAVQDFLDAYLEAEGGRIDYIHGEDTLEELCRRDDAVGFVMPPVGKGSFFRGIMAGGVLPRKTFSMGHAREKRYYLEARRIRRAGE
ncbi:MAG: DUF1015 domain-containing protein [Mailhella sp.]|nr:DUF1015 domain-containing protein [Mailhella sp.]